MSWERATLLALVSVLLAFSLSEEAGAAAVPDHKATSKTGSQSSKVFMQDADAANFFRRRSRRTTKSQDEIDAEQRQVLAADKKKRDYHEEQRNRMENYAEEQGDEQDERTRESTEQWREFHYDGLHPPNE